MVTAPARRELVRHLVAKGLSERRSLAVVRMSASAYRYWTDQSSIDTQSPLCA